LHGKEPNLSHGEHHHPHARTAGRRLLWVILFNAIITLTEYVAGLLSGSLALVSDAGHNFSDVLALILGYAGEKVVERQPTARYSFGLRRAEVLIALVNALSLVAIGAYVVIEAVDRFRNPAEIDAGILLPVALVGLFGNLFSVLILRRDRNRNLNLRAAFLHLAFDTLSSIAVVGVGVVLLFQPWVWLDLVVSLLIVVMMVWGSIGVINESLRVILQAAPSGLDPEKVHEAILAVPNVREAHGLHVWSVNSNEVFLSCHVCVSNGDATDTDQVIVAINKALEESFGIRHTTVQVETANLCRHRNGAGCCP